MKVANAFMTLAGVERQHHPLDQVLGKPFTAGSAKSLELFVAQAVNQNAVVHSFGEQTPKENALAPVALCAVHSFSVTTLQNSGIVSTFG